ncbi:MAG: hypothetical protein M3Q69_14515 [Acidobacteriota bacterium]|nr:hypothetical protein [Acidobacteriota bacterium]
MPLARSIAAPHSDGYWYPAGRSEWFSVKPLAIVNRFDLAPADYRSCGEYRLIFSRRTEDAARLHIAFEVPIANPRPADGKAGCAEVAAFWLQLARTDSDLRRREMLERFFFAGGQTFGPLLDAAPFERSGRIRTSLVSTARPQFRQFEVRRNCVACVPELVPVPLDNTPDRALFAADTGDARAAAFRREFLGQVASLAIQDANRFFMTIDRRYSVSSNERGAESNYRLPFRRAVRTTTGQEFRREIAAELQRAGSALTPEDIVARAETQNCVGCHGGSGPVGGGIVFPKAFDSGEHIADPSVLQSPRLSAALVEVFIPYRIRALTQYARVTGLR